MISIPFFCDLKVFKSTILCLNPLARYNSIHVYAPENKNKDMGCTLLINNSCGQADASQQILEAKHLISARFQT